MRRELFLEVQRVLDVPFSAWPHLEALSRRFGCALGPSHHMSHMAAG